MRLIEMSDYNRAARAYWWSTTALGGLTFAYTIVGLAHLDRGDLLKLVALMGMAYFAGLRPIRVPDTQVLISPCDTFVFLAALFGGMPAAMLVATMDAFAVSYRTSKRWTSRLGGPALTAISIFISANLFEKLLIWLPNVGLFGSAALIAALLIFSLSHFVLSSLLLTLLHALKKQVSPFRLWWENYSWTGLAFAASASAAGLIYLASKEYGIVPVLAALPIVAIIFATAHFYFKQAEERLRADRERLEAAEAQAQQAAQHARELEASEERFRSAFNYAAIGMALVAPDGLWLQVNRALCDLLGYSQAELLATNFQSLTHPDDVDMASRHLAQLLVQDASITPIEKRYVHKLGHTVWTLLSASLVRDAKSNSSSLIFQIQDITDRKRAEQKLAHNALHDGLTELPNRALFVDHLKLAMARAERHAHQQFAVLFLDFDRFKVINDSLGHHIGDQLLIAIARRLERRLRGVDTVARLGGDEFIILLEDIRTAAEATAFAENLQSELAAPFKIGDQEIFTSASIGIVMSSRDYKRPEEILRDADSAMYRAKALGTAKITQFDKSMHDQALRLLQLETDLRRAVERQEFFLVYQPIVSLDTAQLVGFEALLRWQHPERGFVNPSEFIPVAEETGYIIPIGQWVLEEACQQMRKWQAARSEELPLQISVNLSGKQLAQDNLVEQITDTLKRTGIAAHQIKLEITESVVMENVEAASATLNQLRALGLPISMDDFGTGYSSLSYLHRLPIDTLKIDRSFVTRIVESHEKADIIRAIVVLAANLGLSVIAEGVETPEQLERLQKLECGNGQGYLFAKPLGAAEAGRLVEQLQQWRAFDVFTKLPFPQDTGNLPINKYTM